MRWAGAMYLCWLAYDCWKEARQPIAATPVGRSRLVHFRRGFVTNLLNPKAALFFIVVVPEFIASPAPSMNCPHMLTEQFAASMPSIPAQFATVQLISPQHLFAWSSHRATVMGFCAQRQLTQSLL